MADKEQTTIPFEKQWTSAPDKKGFVPAPPPPQPQKPPAQPKKDK